MVPVHHYVAYLQDEEYPYEDDYVVCHSSKFFTDSYKCRSSVYQEGFPLPTPPIRGGPINYIGWPYSLPVHCEFQPCFPNLLNGAKIVCKPFPGSIHYQDSRPYVMDWNYPWDDDFAAYLRTWRYVFFVFSLGGPFRLRLPGSYIRFSDGSCLISSGPGDYLIYMDFWFRSGGFAILVHCVCNNFHGINKQAAFV